MKALMLYIDPVRFALFQVIRPLSKKLCYSGPLSALKLVNIPEPELPSPEWDSGTRRSSPATLQSGSKVSVALDCPPRSRGQTARRRQAK